MSAIKLLGLNLVMQEISNLQKRLNCMKIKSNNNTVEHLYKGHPWSEDKVATTEGGLYRGVQFVRKVAMKADSTSLYRGVGLSREWPL